MNFTREPIIETVITPREGCKLVVRNSKGNGQEDYFVDAVEVVSFGHSFFFRSSERPKSFLVPVSDYEILELKETRMVLKNVSTDRSIKIGGGREAPPPRQQHKEQEPREEISADSRSSERPPERPPMDRKRDKRRRGRRGRDRHEPQSQSQEPYSQDSQERSPDRSFEESPLDDSPVRSSEEEPVVKAPSFISKLFPPPPTLIKDNLSRYKTAESPDGETFFKEGKTTFEETAFEEEDRPIPKETDENPSTEE
ncbi:MAG TPA: hypothetical protein VLE89_02210 [Chlamydiales bacterium]|nr:hypothetical protein [Chlamydiales bacterium]